MDAVCLCLSIGVLEKAFFRRICSAASTRRTGKNDTNLLAHRWCAGLQAAEVLDIFVFKCTEERAVHAMQATVAFGQGGFGLEAIYARSNCRGHCMGPKSIANWEISSGRLQRGPLGRGILAGKGCRVLFCRWLAVCFQWLQRRLGGEGIYPQATEELPTRQYLRTLPCDQERWSFLLQRFFAQRRLFEPSIHTRAVYDHDAARATIQMATCSWVDERPKFGSSLAFRIVVEI